MDSLLHGIIIIITILYTTPHNTHYLIYTLYTSQYNTHTQYRIIYVYYKRVWKKKGLLLLFLLLSLLLLLFIFFYDPINIPIRSVQRACARIVGTYTTDTAHILSITRARALTRLGPFRFYDRLVIDFITIYTCILNYYYYDLRAKYLFIIYR